MAQILLLTKKVPYPSTDGESIVIMSDLQMLKSLGHTIHVLAINTSKHYIDTKEYHLLPFWDSFRSINVSTSHSIPKIIKSIIYNCPYQLYRFYNAPFQVVLNEILNTNKIDIVIYQGLAMTQYAVSNSVKKIYRAHNVENKIWSSMQSFYSKFFEKIVFKFIANSLFVYEKHALQFIDEIVTINTYELDFFSHLYPNKSIHTIALSLSNDYFKGIKQITSQKPNILLVGSLDWRPNIEGIDWFLDTIYSKISNIPLTIAGKGKVKDAWKRPNISFKTNFESLEQLFEDHSILIVPLLSGAGIRIKLIEAMKYAMPTMATLAAWDGILNNPSRELLISEEINDINYMIEIINNKSKLEQNASIMKQLYIDNCDQTTLLETWKSVVSL